MGLNNLTPGLPGGASSWATGLGQANRMGNPGLGNQLLGNQMLGSQGFGGQGLGSQGLGNQTFGSQGLGSNMLGSAGLQGFQANQGLQAGKPPCLHLLVFPHPDWPGVQQSPLPRRRNPCRLCHANAYPMTEHQTC